MPSSLFGPSQYQSQKTPVQQRPNLDQAKDILRNSPNPMAAVQMMASQGNPNAQFALSQLQNGSTAKQAVLNILQQRGIPFQAFLQNFK